MSTPIETPKPTDNSKDDPMKVLEDFNAANEASSEGQTKEPEPVEVKPTVESPAEPVDPPVEPVTKAPVEGEAPPADVVEWLIDKKFKDDPEGRKALVDSYKGIQGRADTSETALKESKDENKTLKELESWLRENPNVVKLIQSEVKKEQNVLVEPSKPEDYDILDEAVPNSSSAKWRNEFNDYLVNRGSAEAKKQVNVLRDELKEESAETLTRNELKAEGLSDEDIAEYETFYSNPENVTTKNSVKAWQHLSGKKVSTKEPETLPNPVDKPVDKGNVTSAAAIPGATVEELTEIGEEAKKVEDSIMALSNK